MQQILLLEAIGKNRHWNWTCFMQVNKFNSSFSSVLFCFAPRWLRSATHFWNVSQKGTACQLSLCLELLRWLSHWHFYWPRRWSTVLDICSRWWHVPLCGLGGYGEPCTLPFFRGGGGSFMLKWVVKVTSLLKLLAWLQHDIFEESLCIRFACRVSNLQLRSSPLGQSFLKRGWVEINFTCCFVDLLKLYYVPLRSLLLQLRYGTMN